MQAPQKLPTTVDMPLTGSRYEMFLYALANAIDEERAEEFEDEVFEQVDKHRPR